MVLKRLFLALCCTLPLMAPGAALRADDRPFPGEVVLPLKDYLALVESAEAADKAREQRVAQQAAPVAEVVSQRTSVRIEDGEARVTSGFEVLVQGHPKQPVTLPLAGFPASAEVRREGRPAPDAAVSAVPGGRGGVLLVAPAAGRYEVEVRGQAPLESFGGTNRLAFPPAAAPVAVLELDLPADAGWSVPGGVVVEESERDGRRRIVLAAQRGESQALELRRRFDSSEAGKLLAQSVVLTLFQLRPEGPRRHDVVLYEVSRGALGSFDVALPPGVEVELAATDEGTAVPVAGSGRLTVHRHRQLQGTGYLVLTSTPPAGIVTDGTAVGFVDPGLDIRDVRASYLAVASSIAADVRPQPEASWARVDLEDLPPSLREALQVVDLAAAWRLANESPGIRLAVSALPPAPSLDLVVRRRETTTLLTVDGTLLHRDRFTLGPVTGTGAALDLVLPAGATLWSASVGNQPVRPLERGGTVSVPLGFESGREAVVEVVAVLDRAIPPGRSALGMDLPQVTAPVLDHRWRLLLPEGPRYRFKDGDLRPTAEGDAVVRRVEDRISVGGNESGVQKTLVAHGPGGNSAITGRVVDDQGSLLPGVTLTLTSSAFSNRIVQVSDAQGRFRFIALPPGDYTLKAELEGFSSLDYPGIELRSGSSADLDITLSTAVMDAITVLGETALLDERRVQSHDFGRKRKEKKEEEKDQSSRRNALYAQEVQALQQGLVGGVKPLSITIPEAGKALLLTGILPPGKVSVELEVRAKR